MLLNLKQFAA